MASEDVAKMLKSKERLINKACSEAVKAHDFPTKPFLEKSSESESEVIFSFPGTWSVGNWCSQGQFGQTKIDKELFPSLRSIGNDEAAEVNEAFQRRFQSVLLELEFQKKVEKAVLERKQIVFAGHSSGGPIAALATMWLLETRRKKKLETPAPFCFTFGSPLAGNRIFSHALRRENWSRFFFHFVAKYDIVPRIFLSPLSELEKNFQRALNLLKPKPDLRRTSSLLREFVAPEFFEDVIGGALTVTSHAACKLMESGNLLLETLTGFVDLSPYRPFGNYVFEGREKTVVIENSEAILQLLFFLCQPGSDEEASVIAVRSFGDHFAYKEMVFVSRFLPDNLQDNLNKAADEFELCPRGRLCLLAAQEAENQKSTNQTKVDLKRSDIEKALRDIESYRRSCELHKVMYYDSFKLQKSPEDFKANVKRLELAGIWDEIIEMLKHHRLPDQFEARPEWIEIGTRFRRQTEPLDIANYYRHLKNEDTGPYMDRARPKRYRYTQRWLERAIEAVPGSCGESCFLAEVEELRGGTGMPRFGERALKLQRDVMTWRNARVVGDDVFLGGSTFVAWWRTLVFPVREIEEHIRIQC